VVSRHNHIIYYNIDLQNFQFIDVVSLSGNGPRYEGEAITIFATAPAIGVTPRTINNITFTINARPVSEIDGLISIPGNKIMQITAFLTIRNISASLNGKKITCIAVLNTEDMVPCTVSTLQVQGKSQH